MIVILYDSSCNETEFIAEHIKRGIERDLNTCIFMRLNNIDFHVLDSARLIIFGCPTNTINGISQEMFNFMNKTNDRFENQVWKNKLAAGFTNVSSDSKKTIEELCNFSAKHSMLWIPQGHIAENCKLENHDPLRRDINKIKSYLGCISGFNDKTGIFFGRHISYQCRLHLFPSL